MRGELQLASAGSRCTLCRASELGFCLVAMAGQADVYSAQKNECTSTAAALVPGRAATAAPWCVGNCKLAND